MIEIPTVADFFVALRSGYWGNTSDMKRGAREITSFWQEFEFVKLNSVADKVELCGETRKLLSKESRN